MGEASERNRRLSNTTDAQVWAREFMAVIGGNIQADVEIDEGLMIGWFANAMGAQRSADNSDRESLLLLLARGVNAFELTRQCVGYELLPAIEGWSWFDWVQAANVAMGSDDEQRPTPRTPLTPAQVDDLRDSTMANRANWKTDDHLVDRLAIIRAQNAAGHYVPSVPLPLYVGRGMRKSQCQCGQVFKSEDAYRGHYAYHHILMEEPLS